jgi:diguanylate cyclase (GGDEF)-like protein
VTDNTAAVEASPRRSVAAVFERLFNRRVGGLSGVIGRAAATTHSFLIFLLTLTLAYVVFHTSYDVEGLSWLIAINLGAAAGYSVGIVVVRLGHQTAASVLALSVALVHIFLATSVLGWQSGLHLYLVAGGQLVLMLFTERQRALRWIFVCLAAATFVYSQTMFPASEASYDMNSDVLALLFSVNAVLTAGLMYVLAALAHLRATSAGRVAAASAERAEYLANTDALTGLSNRRPVMEHLEVLSANPATPYCVGLADLDYFKALNDEYGHVCGDRVLATIGERLRTHVRPTDSLGRWGGEEFVFVLPGAALADALAMMERMRAIVGEHVVPCSGHSHHVSISIGVAERAPGAMSHRVIKHADDALYEAKASGRNRVRAYEPAPGDDSAGAFADVAINPDGGEGHRTHRRRS